MIRRILGIIILLVSLVIVAICAAGAYYIGPALDSIGDGLDSTLLLAEDALVTVSATLEQTKATISEVNNGISTADKTTADLSKTIADTIPLIVGVNEIVTSQAPQNIENVQAAIPAMAEVAGVVDTTLTTLSNFGIDQSFNIPLPFGNDISIPLQFDLGIEYAPTEPFDETVLTLGTGLDGLPDQMRLLGGDLDLAAENLQVVSDDILQASQDLEAMNQEIALFIPLLDEYLRLLDEIITNVGQIRTQYNAQVETIKTVGLILFIFMALTQLAPLVFGWDLITGRGNVKKQDDEPESEPPIAVVEKSEEPPTEVDESEEQTAAVQEPLADNAESQAEDENATAESPKPETEEPAEDAASQDETTQTETQVDSKPPAED